MLDFFSWLQPCRGECCSRAISDNWRKIPIAQVTGSLQIQDCECGVTAVWLLTLRGWTITIIWLALFTSCLGAMIAVVLGVLFRRPFLWWCASTLALFAIVLSVSLAALDRLGFK